MYDEKLVLEICNKYGIKTEITEGYSTYLGKEMDENFSISEIMREPIEIIEDN